jgi:hypothetical protein
VPLNTPKRRVSTQQKWTSPSPRLVVERVEHRSERERPMSCNRTAENTDEKARVAVNPGEHGQQSTHGGSQPEWQVATATLWQRVQRECNASASPRAAQTTAERRVYMGPSEFDILTAPPQFLERKHTSEQSEQWKRAGPEIRRHSRSVDADFIGVYSRRRRGNKRPLRVVRRHWQGGNSTSPPPSSGKSLTR